MVLFLIIDTVLHVTLDVARTLHIFASFSYLHFSILNGTSLQPKGYTSGENDSSGVLELSEASIESSGAKAKACGTLSVLASLSNKGTTF
jgi:hypothetical protein